MQLDMIESRFSLALSFAFKEPEAYANQIRITNTQVKATVPRHAMQADREIRHIILLQEEK